MASKRIGIIITAQHLIPHGGIGQFAKGIAELAMNNDCIVDLIVDTDEHKMFFNINGRLVIPDNITSMQEYRDLSGMFGNYLRLETSINIRNSLMKALKNVIYDMLIINSPDALYGVQSLCLVDKIPTVYYTHAENLVDASLTKGPIHLYCDEVIRSLLRASPIIVGTQVHNNKISMEKNNINSIVLPMPTPETDLLEDSSSFEKEGVLFIGRLEERKNFDDFIKIMKGKDCLIKVMTAESHIKRAESILKENGFCNFIVKGGIIGEEKNNFIKTSKILICPSKRESYCFALNECLPHMPCLVLEKYNWWSILDCPYLISGDNNKLSTIVDNLLLSQNDTSEQLEWCKNREHDIWSSWEDILLKNTSENVGNRSSISNMDDFYLNDFYSTLERPVAVSDIITTYNTLSKYNIKQGKDFTWLSSKGSPPKKRNVKNTFFTFDY